MRFYKIIYILVYFQFFCTSVHTVNHYVDKSAKGHNNGTSWSNAWESFSDIEWNQIQPGDIIYISGGTDSTTYYERLNIQTSSGTAANLITIRNGLEAGHNGKVIIDGEDIRLCVEIRYVSYIRFAGITLQNGKAQGSRGQLTVIYPGSGIYIDSVTTLYNNGWGLFAIGLQGSNYLLDSVYFRYCTVINSTVTPNQSDGFMAQFMKNLFLIGNYFRSDNSDQTGHSEPCYIQHVENYWIEGNKFISTNDITLHQTFHTHSLKGTLTLFNNLFWGRDQSGTNSQWMANVYIGENGDMHNSVPDGDTSVVYFYNNTVIGSNNAWMVNIQVDTINMKNNVFYKSVSTASPPLYFRKAVPMGLIDYNIYGDVASTDNLLWISETIPYDATYNMVELNALGSETGGTPSNRDRVDPLFIDTDDYFGDGCGIRIGSPCIDAGVDLPAPFNVDINGVTRLPGHFTIGAYEYVAP